MSDGDEYVTLRERFDEDAVRYDRARPRYPVELFDDLAAAGVTAGAGVLEIGCGTGQATVSLAERGCRIVAVELGADLAALARRNLARFDAVEVVTAAFEGWALPAEPFDVVFAATAFHWIDPAVRVSKSADAVRLGGLLATVGTHHIAGGSWDEAFFDAIQECYSRFDPSTPAGLRLQRARDIVEDDRELVSSGRFGAATFSRYEWEQSYSTAEYLDLLLTYSGHRALPDEQRSALLDAIARLIDVELGGRIVKRYLTELRVARRVR
ncbi:class I SAM-dependent methyltransferase [Dactylosporangium sp. NPDC051541]|uniref:class I SAM-dependent methyltransferase n=1 Tax=Dactylosporangium sp. NPDC051541 TaxID=3363977 RepID=UPI0037B15C1A